MRNLPPILATIALVTTDTRAGSRAEATAATGGAFLEVGLEDDALVLPVRILAGDTTVDGGGGVASLLEPEGGILCETLAVTAGAFTGGTAEALVGGTAGEAVLHEAVRGTLGVSSGARFGHVADGI